MLMDIKEIMNTIPHRSPFLLIDRVEAKLPEEERAAFREEFPELNESLGHRPIEAVFGSLLGIAIAALLQLAYG